MEISTKLGVDAGNISIMDLSYIQRKNGKYCKTAERLCKKITVEPGKYEININILDCWNGKINKTCIIDTQGEIVIGDACYLFSSEEVNYEMWAKFLDETDYLHNTNDNFYCVDTGGDGEFNCEITITKI